MNKPEINIKIKSAEAEPHNRCPQCGEPLRLIGFKTLEMPKNRKVVCDKCMYEDDF